MGGTSNLPYRYKVLYVQMDSGKLSRKLESEWGGLEIIDI